MTAPDDMIRRGDVLAIVFPDACSEARKGALCLHPSCENVRYSPILEAIRALPADPVAEARTRLADHEVRDGPWKLISGKVLCRYCYAPSDGDGHAPECLWETYRAAVAARSAGTVPPAPKPAPACARCGGSGEIRLYLPDEPDYHVTDPCPDCRGKP